MPANIEPCVRSERGWTLVRRLQLHPRIVDRLLDGQTAIRHMNGVWIFSRFFQHLFFFCRVCCLQGGERNRGNHCRCIYFNSLACTPLPMNFQEFACCTIRSTCITIISKSKKRHIDKKQGYAEMGEGAGGGGSRR